jgi:hypothetical protein
MKASGWLPNPISRSVREVENALSLLEKYEYQSIEHTAAGSSRIDRAVSIAYSISAN